MTGDTLRFILQVIGVFIGGSAVQLLIFLIKRRAEVRNLNVTSDVGLLGAAQAQVTGLMATETSLRSVIADKDKRIEALDEKLLTLRDEHTKELERNEEIVSSLSNELARCKLDLSTARFQLGQVTNSGIQYPRHRSQDEGNDS